MADQHLMPAAELSQCRNIALVAKIAEKKNPAALTQCILHTLAKPLEVGHLSDGAKFIQFSQHSPGLPWAASSWQPAFEAVRIKNQCKRVLAAGGASGEESRCLPQG